MSRKPCGPQLERLSHLSLVLMQVVDSLNALATMPNDHLRDLIRNAKASKAGAYRTANVVQSEWCRRLAQLLCH